MHTETVFRFLNYTKPNVVALKFGGAVIYNKGVFVDYNPLKSLNDVQLTNILKDNEGNYWAGTFASGLYKLRLRMIRMIDKEDGLMNTRMLSLTKLNDGSLLFGTNCGGVYQWKNEKLLYPNLNKKGNVNCSWTLFQDSKGVIWMGSRGIYTVSDLDQHPNPVMQGEWFNHVEIFAITEDSKSRIWVSTANGLIRFDERGYTHFTVDDGLFFNDARALYEDEDGVMWVGTKAGLNTINNNVVDRVYLTEENQNAAVIQQPYIRAFHKDKMGALWIGTYGDGLFRMENGNIDRLTTAHGLFDNVISHIVEDETENFWIGSNRGLWRVKKADLNNVIDGKIETLQSYSYDNKDGMNSAETNGGFQPSFIQDTTGNIYFPTIDGIAVISTRDVIENSKPPQVYIENVSTQESSFGNSKIITIPYGTPFLKIDYTAVSFTDAKKVRFKYRLEGLEKEWIDVGDGRSAIYSKIPSGKYQFRVIASNNDGVWNTTGAAFKITITPPIWDTSWFYALALFAFLAFSGIFYYQRVDKLEKENEQQKYFTEQLIDSQELERRRIAAELHDGLGQQILVIKNRAEMAQQTIGDNKQLANQLTEIIKSAGLSINEVRSISHNLRPVHLEKFGITEAIENLCEQLVSSSSTEWSYYIDNIDNELDQGKEINFYRVIQEATNNVQRHAEATEAFISVKKKPRFIISKVWDNGKGFVFSKQENSGGLGFIGMKERIHFLGGEIEVNSKLGGGTSLLISIPRRV